MRRQGRLKTALAVVLALAPAAAAACEPCASSLGLSDTVAAATLIVIARSPSSPGEPGLDGENGPQSYEVEVESVLKGEFAAKKMTVLGWQGMCAYGFTDWKRPRQMLFLYKPHMGTAVWRTVGDGCAVKSLEVRGESVLIEDKPAPVSGFVRRYGLKGATGGKTKAAPR